MKRVDGAPAFTKGVDSQVGNLGCQVRNLGCQVRNLTYEYTQCDRLRTPRGDGVGGLVGDEGGDEGFSDCDDASGVAGDQGIDQAAPPGTSHAVATDGDHQEEGQHKEALEVGVEIVEPGGEAGEVGGEFRTTSGGRGGCRRGKIDIRGSWELLIENGFQ